ncbi:MAG: hypothetical protein PWQ96_720 [Clostridia bacterium]|jgi:hypothetical protein|nr:non-ribosomal peptide synthetase module [Clostridiales bacterium]MDK2985078.1 hypothetical protein [Clostridia bacterium]
MHYNSEQVMKAFELYTELAQKGSAEKEHLQDYLADDAVRGLVDQFARKVDCIVIIAGERLYLVPETKLSPFHVKNDTLKKTYLGSKATNQDLYMMYLAIIVFFGEFYDSYNTIEATRDFLPLQEWVKSIDRQIATLKEHSEEELIEYEKEYSYNWRSIIEKWEAMDPLKETAKKQTGNTISRMSFLDSVKRFLEDQELAIDLGNNELALTEKAKTIVQRYFMDLEYNRGILEFMYGFDKRKGDT